MPIRINATTSTDTSATFVPSGDFSVGAEFEAGSTAYIDVEAQIDGAATPPSPWVPIGTISPLDNPPIKRFAKLPNIRLRLYNNGGGKFARAWSGE